MTQPAGRRPDDAVAASAKRALARAERGDTGGADALDDIAPEPYTSVAAAEQEADDGPKSLGLSR